MKVLSNSLTSVLSILRQMHFSASEGAVKVSGSRGAGGEKVWYLRECLNSTKFAALHGHMEKLLSLSRLPADSRALQVFVLATVPSSCDWDGVAHKAFDSLLGGKVSSG